MTFNRFTHTVLFVYLTSLSCSALSSGNDIFNHIEKGNVTKMMELVKAKVITLEAKNSDGDTAVIVAARHGQLEMLRFLVKNGANINILDRRKRDVLNIAITTKNPELVRVALDLGSDPTLVTSVYDGGAIIYGSAKGAVEIVELLIKAGAPVNRVNNLGWTALLEVAILGDGSENYISIAEMLIKAGADKTITDKEGKTPFDHASSKGHVKLARILKPGA